MRRLTCSGIWSPLFHRPFLHPRSLYSSIPELICAKISFAILLPGCKMSFSILTAEGKAPPSDIPHAQKQNPLRFLVLSAPQSASFEQPLPPSKTSGIYSPSTAAVLSRFCQSYHRVVVFASRRVCSSTRKSPIQQCQHHRQ